MSGNESASEKCPNCGEPLVAGRVTCAKCGAAIYSRVKSFQPTPLWLYVLLVFGFAVFGFIGSVYMVGWTFLFLGGELDHGGMETFLIGGTCFLIVGLIVWSMVRLRNNDRALEELRKSGPSNES
jgi:hypothetical protein